METTKKEAEKEAPEVLESLALFRDDWRLVPMALRIIAVDAKVAGVRVSKDAERWSLGDKRDKGPGAGIPVAEAAVLDAEGTPRVGVLATYRRGDKVREELFPVALSLKSGQAASPEDPRLLTTMMGPASGSRRTVTIRPCLATWPDGTVKFFLSPGMDSGEVAKAAYDPFAEDED